MVTPHPLHGPDATVTQILKEEHRVIEKVLDALEQRLNRGGDGPVDRDFFEKALDFCRNFADRCHHAKEEDEMFPVLERVGIPREGGPIGCMLHEHEEGRCFLRTIAETLPEAANGENAAVQAVQQAARGYIALLRQHIQKEDDVLFAMADQVLDPQAQKAMLACFDRADQENNRDGKYAGYLTLADELSRRAICATDNA